MNLLNEYGISERFLAQATMFPDYTTARVVAQYRGKYKIVTEHKEIEVKKGERMFKEVGGMKNVRRYTRENNKRK